MSIVLRRMMVLGLGLFYWTVASAVINIEITRGAEVATPIAVMPFEGAEGTEADVGVVIRSDLGNSARFNPLLTTQLPPIADTFHSAVLKTWRGKGVENIVSGKIESVGRGRFDIECTLYDLYKIQALKAGGDVAKAAGAAPTVIWKKTFRDIPQARLRRLGHHLSDLIYETLTGQRGYFSSWIAYIMVHDGDKRSEHREYTLEIADYDGHHPRPLVKSKKPMMSPAWSPDGRRLAYVSFENKKAEIYSIDLASGARDLLSNYPGINGAPAFSPDGRTLALTLSKDGSPKIYLLDLETRALRQMTHGLSIDTEPSFDPRGEYLLFTSNRSGGKPQIYQMKLSGGEPERLTYQGSYNARASYSPDGQWIAFMHKGEQDAYRIAIQERRSGKFRVLTGASDDESPSWAPSSNMIIYGTQEGAKEALGIVSIDGRYQWRLPARLGNVQEPAWSPFLS